MSDKRQRAAVIAAMESEMQMLREALEEAETVVTAGGTYYIGRIGSTDVILMQCGIGKVSAALGAQAVISGFAPDYVINTGCAGGIGRGLQIGDIVIASEAAEWDLDITALGYPRGYIDSLGGVRIEADRGLGARIAEHIPAGVQVRHGLIVSGDQFISTDEQRAIILESFPDALCAEMEGAAIAHVCRQNGVPFAVIRSLSDTADSGSTVDFTEFSEQAGRQSAGILIEMFRA